MNDARTAFRALLVYVVCIPLALLLGYLLANPFDTMSITMVGVVLIVLVAPLLIQYHYAFMLLALNMGAVVFFLPGRMNLWIVAVTLSFAVSFTHRILDRKVHFISVPQLTRPLLVLLAVVLLTAEARGGIGLRSMGAEAAGGRRYFEIFIGILGYFALTTRVIPLERVPRYLALFFLGGAASMISILYGKLPGVFDFVFLFIPPTHYAMGEVMGTGGGLAGVFRPFATAANLFFAFMLARYGIQGIMAPGHKRRLVVMVIVVVMGVLSGSRLALVSMIMIFAFQFWLEGLLRSRLAVFFGFLMVLAACLVIPFATKLPYTMQRTLALLPIEVDPIVRSDVRGSSEWRIEIWRAALPQIPEYLLLGKGYAISRQDLAYMTDRAFKSHSVEERGAFIAGDYHNGPLSVIIPLGIWGVIAFLWFLGAGVRVLWRNYKYGALVLASVNTYLLASFLAMIIGFCFVFGSLYSGLIGFTGVLGLSVALNGGVAAPPPRSPALPVKPAERKPRISLAHKTDPVR